MTDRARPSIAVRVRFAAVLAGVLVTTGFATPAMAAARPVTRLVRCGDQNCLVVSGHRDNVAATVSINGHEVPVKGARGWQARLPVETLREWSLPYARTIEVTLRDPGTQREASAEARLPVGLLGHVTNLASLVVSIR